MVKVVNHIADFIRYIDRNGYNNFLIKHAITDEKHVEICGSTPAEIYTMEDRNEAAWRMLKVLKHIRRQQKAVDVSPHIS